jgi:hypothetical protein
MAENTAVAEKKAFTTSLSEWSNAITGLIIDDYKSCGMDMDDYAKECAMEAMTSIFNLVKSNPKVNMGSLDTSNLRGIVKRCASLKLNASAYPRECYFQLRNVNIGKDADGKEIWQQQVEMGIEGSGYDSLLTNYGKDVKQVYPYWIVKEGDKYIPPKHKGLTVTEPEWEENSVSDKAVRVVYPVKLMDGTVTYLSADRDSVKVNLLAHVKQNMMNETFGVITGTKKQYNKEVARTRYDATPEEKAKIKEKKEEVLNALRACKTVDEMLECELARPFISGAWLDTPESMIQRKMCNNATRKYPKNYDPMARQAQVEMDEVYQVAQAEITENANTVEFIEDKADVVDSTATEATEEQAEDSTLPPFMQAE